MATGISKGPVHQGGLVNCPKVFALRREAIEVVLLAENRLQVVRELTLISALS